MNYLWELIFSINFLGIIRNLIFLLIWTISYWKNQFNIYFDPKFSHFNVISSPKKKQILTNWFYAWDLFNIHLVFSFQFHYTSCMACLFDDSPGNGNEVKQTGQTLKYRNFQYKSLGARSFSPTWWGTNVLVVKYAH